MDEDEYEYNVQRTRVGLSDLVSDWGTRTSADRALGREELRQAAREDGGRSTGKVYFEIVRRRKAGPIEKVED